MKAELEKIEGKWCKSLVFSLLDIIVSSKKFYIIDLNLIL